MAARYDPSLLRDLQRRLALEEAKREHLQDRLKVSETGEATLKALLAAKSLVEDAGADSNSSDSVQLESHCLARQDEYGVQHSLAMEETRRRQAEEDCAVVKEHLTLVKGELATCKVQAAIFEDEVEELQQQLEAEIVRRTDAEKLVPDFEKELDTILQLLTAESFRAEALERERNDLLERHTSLSQEHEQAARELAERHAEVQLLVDSSSSRAALEQGLECERVAIRRQCTELLNQLELEKAARRELDETFHEEHSGVRSSMAAETEVLRRSELMIEQAECRVQDECLLLRRKLATEEEQHEAAAVQVLTLQKQLFDAQQCNNLEVELCADEAVQARSATFALERRCLALEAQVADEDTKRELTRTAQDTCSVVQPSRTAGMMTDPSLMMFELRTERDELLEVLATIEAKQALAASRTMTSARAPLTAPGKTPRSALHSSSSRLHEQRCDSVPAGLPRAQTDELTRSRTRHRSVSSPSAANGDGGRTSPRGTEPKATSRTLRSEVKRLDVAPRSRRCEASVR